MFCICVCHKQLQVVCFAMTTLQSKLLLKDYLQAVAGPDGFSSLSGQWTLGYQISCLYRYPVKLLDSSKCRVWQSLVKSIYAFSLNESQTYG